MPACRWSCQSSSGSPGWRGCPGVEARIDLRPGPELSGSTRRSATKGASARSNCSPFTRFLPSEVPCPWTAPREGGECGIELTRVELYQQVVQISERCLQRGGLAAVNAGMVAPALRSCFRYGRAAPGRCMRPRRTTPASRSPSRPPESASNLEISRWRVTSTSPPGTDRPSLATDPDRHVSVLDGSTERHGCRGERQLRLTTAYCRERSAERLEHHDHHGRKQ